MNSWAFLGLTGSFKGNKRDLRMYNAIFCEDDYVSFNLRWPGSKAMYSAKAGFKSKLYLDPVNAEGKNVPTTLPNYNLRATTSCGNVGKINILNTYTFYAEIYNCTRVGTHTVTIFSGKGQNAQVAKFTVAARAFEKLLVQEPTKVIGGKTRFVGGKKAEDYVFSDYHGQVPIKIKTTDAFGNIWNLGSSDEQICKALGVYSNNPKTQMGKCHCAGGNGDYTVYFPIDITGLYELGFNFPTKSRYYMNFIFGAPVIERSLFSLQAARSPSVEIGTLIKSTCNLKDSLNNSLKGIDVKDIYKGNFKCSLVRTSINGRKTTVEGKITNTAQGFDCTYTVTKVGMYVINGYLQVNGGVYSLVPARINSFRVYFYPKDIKKIRWYNPSTKTYHTDWKRNEIQFSKNAEYLTKIVFLTEDGENTGIRSGHYLSPNFKLTNLSAQLYADDDKNYTDTIKIEGLVLDNTKYYVFKNSKGKDYFRKSSAPYYLNLKLKGITAQLKIKIALGDTNGETVCIQPLTPDWTIFEPTEFLPMITMNVGQDVKIGDIMLRTENDCLYNYWVENDRFTFNTKGSYLIRHDSVEGMYELRLKTSDAGTKYMECSLDDYEFIGGYEVEVRAKPQICEFIADVRKNKFANKEKLELVNQTNDNDVLYYFQGKDCYGNVQRMSPARYNRYMGLRMNVKINGKSNISRFQRRRTSNIVYDRRKRSYVFYDYFKIAGKYQIEIIGANRKKYSFSYYKAPGVVSISNSNCNTVSAEEIVFAKTASVVLNLADKFKVNLTEDETHCQNELKKIKVIAVSEDRKNTYSFKFSKIENGLVHYTSEAIKRASKFNIAVTYDENPLGCDSRCGFKVRYGDIFMANTKCSIILSERKPIEGIPQIANTKDRPVFSCKFFDDGDNFIGKVKETDLKAFNTYVNGNRFNIALEQTWVNNNEFMLNVKESDSTTLIRAVSSPKYHLNLDYKEKPGKRYELKFLGDGEDQDAGNGKKVNANTVVDNPDCKIIAGASIQVNVELRTVDKLRVNFFENLKMFGVINSNSGDTSFKWRVQNGNKKGRYIFTFISTKKTSPNFNTLTITINNEKVPTAIKFTVSSSTLSSLIFEKASLTDSQKNILKGGVVTEPTDIKLNAFDKFKNRFDGIHDKVAYSNDRICSLLGFDHIQGENVYANCSTNVEKDNINLSFRTKKTGIVTISSKFLNGGYQSNFKPGPPSSETSFIEVKDNLLTAGEKVHCQIHVHDKYDNEISCKELGKEKAEDFISIAVHSNKKQTDLKNNFVDESKTINFSNTLTLSGKSQIRGELEGNDLKCINCNLKVDIGPCVFKKSKLQMIKKDGSASTMSIKTATTIEQNTFPTWKINLFDNFKNKFDTIPKNYTFKGTFNGPKIEVPLCSEIEDDHVIFKVCPDVKARNVWKYLLPKKGYNLQITRSVTDKSAILPETIKYPSTITGEAADPNASNGDMVIKNTWFSTKKLEVIAGQTATFRIEVRDIEHKRRNYWVLKPQEQVKVNFSIEGKYKTEVNTADKPGQYEIKVVSTKTYTEDDANLVSITIDGQKCTATTVLFIVNPCKPVRGELRDREMQKKIDGLPVGNADLSFKFGVCLYDQYDNLANISAINYNYKITSADGKRKTSNCVKHTDGRCFRITLRTVKAGVWKFEDPLISKKPITWNVYPGRIVAQNTKVFAPNQQVAGKSFVVSIVPFDYNGNYVDPRTCALNPVEFMVKHSTTPGKFTQYAVPKGVVGKLAFIEDKKINNFNNIDKISEFELAGDKQEVYITSGKGKCLVATDSILTAKTDKCDK
ncbi:MAG: hypothetical protein GY861_00375, partial [bacterium]|nr:hypothetical protein [bacterium]